MSVLLNQQQISDLLQRNPQFQSLIQTALSSNQWPNGNQVCPTQDSWLGLFSGSPDAIGYNITDDVYGTITLACDASGVIQYNANTPVQTGVMNQGPIVSPTVPVPTGPGCPGWGNIQSFNDFLSCSGDLATTAVSVGVVYMLYQIFK